MPTHSLRAASDLMSFVEELATYLAPKASKHIQFVVLSACDATQCISLCTDLL